VAISGQRRKKKFKKRKKMEIIQPKKLRLILEIAKSELGLSIAWGIRLE
jgi:hypothetical protein